MTNDELIQLVQQKTPDELTPAEIKLLRSRVRDSKELREAVADNLQIETFLFQTLGQVSLSVDEIVDHGGRKRRTSTRGWLGTALLLLLMLVAIGLPIAVYFHWNEVQDYVANYVVPPSDLEPLHHDVIASESDQTSKTPSETLDDPTTPELNHTEDADNTPPVEPKAPVPVETPAKPESTDKPNDNDKPPEPAPAPVPEILTPWQDVVENADAPRRFEEICFQNFDVTASLTHVDEVKQWFEEISGHRSRFFQQKTSAGMCGWFEGLVRLKSPWHNDTALRLALESYNQLQIHFFSGGNGVTLAFYEDRNFTWAGYTTTREPNGVEPSNFALTATDEGRNARTEIRFGGPLELRHRDGEIILSRGDIILLRVPFEKKIEQVHFKGRAAFYGIEMVRTEDFPPREPPFPIAADYERPADLPWIEHVDEAAQFEKLDDGSVRLSANQAKTHSWVATPLPTSGIHEIILELDGVRPGAGVFLGDKERGPLRVLRFFKNTRDNRLTVTFAIDGYQADLTELAERLVPYCTEHVWIKLLAGQGTMRFWVSSDGVHWGMPEGVYSNDAGRATHVGLHQFAVAPESSIELRRLTIRKLPELSSIVAPEIIARTAPHSDVPNFEQWKLAVIRARPVDVEIDEWIHASVIRTLNAGSNQEFANRLLDLILDSDSVRAMPVEKQMAILDEVCLLADVRNRDNLLALVDRYHNLSQTAYRTDRRLPHSSMCHVLMTTPLATDQNFRIASEPLLRIELIELLYNQKWREAIEFCQRLRFFQQHQQIPLVDWAEVTARRQLPRSGPLGQAVLQKTEWEHPLDVELNKDAYNIMAELHALLESDAAEEVAKMITSIDPSTFAGVAPHGKDRDHFVSFGAAIQMAIRAAPRLRDEIDRQYGELAKLRIRKAITSGDEEAVKLASMQFESTSAAAEAHAWLGDRALSSGWFPRAMSEYRRASQTAGPALRENLAARLRLAGAMMGRDVGDPVASSVDLGELTFTAEEFESLVEEMVHREKYQAVVRKDLPQQRTLPPPSGLKVEGRGRLDGLVGEQPTTELTRHVRRHQVDWVGRQIATLIDGSTLFASNRFQVMAFNLESGRQLWHSEHLDDPMMRCQDWGLTPMQPLATDLHVFARLMYGSSPQLVCLDKSNGSRIWTSKLPGNEHMVSDAMIIQDQLVALSILKSSSRRSVLRLTRFARQTGEVIQQDELAQVRESWWRRRFCAATPMDDAVVASLGGFIISCDISGDVRWIRRQVAAPTEEEHTWVRQAFQPPRLSDNRLYVVQPGVRSLECLDPDTGNRIWNSVLPNVTRLIGLTKTRIVVQTADGFVGLKLENGQIAWQSKAADCLEAMLLDKNGQLAFTQRIAEPQNSNQSRIRMTWLAGDDGSVVASTKLKGTSDEDVCAGPMFVQKNRLWTFIGPGKDVPERNVAELVTDGDVEPLEKPRQTVNILSSRVGPSVHEAVAAVQPDWMLFNGVMPAATESENTSEEPVLRVDSLPGSAVLLGRALKIPDTEQPRLRIQLGHQRAYLMATVNGQLLSDGPVEAKFPEQEWKYVDIDLSAFRNKLAWITISSRSSNAAERMTTLWRSSKVVP